MVVETIRPSSANYPPVCRQITPKPPVLYYYGGDFGALLSRPRVAIVGTRRISAYGEQVTRNFARQLAEQGVVIVSGLALGVDAAAHEACLEAGGLTLAVLPSPLDNVAPATNRHLAERILAAGGGLLSQYPAGSEVHKGNFVERNEVVAAVSSAVIVTEAGENSGTSHTVNFALDLSVPVFVVPGNITSPTSVGANNVLKSGRSQIMTRVEDILPTLGITLSKSNQRQAKGANDEEQCLLDLLGQGISDGYELLNRSQLSAEQFASTLTMLEITAKIVPLGANHWALG